MAVLGCSRPDLSIRNTKHGLTKLHPRAYRSWRDMRGRCNNKNNDDYKDYGGRGITVCARWDDFAAFMEDMGDRPRGTSIERRNNNGNYEPTNCMWADPTTQASNKRSNRHITYAGETRTLASWCRRYGLDHSKVRYRLANGWGFERAFGLM